MTFVPFALHRLLHDKSRSSLDHTQEQMLRDMNEALMVSAVRQHELAELAERAQQVLQENVNALALVIEQRTADLAAALHAMHDSEHKARIGALAAGLVHDMGNLLMPLRCRFDMLTVPHTDSEMAANAESLHKIGDYLQGLVGNMRRFIDDPASALGTQASVDLYAWGRSTKTLLRSIVPKHIGFQFDVPNASDASDAPPQSLPRLTVNPNAFTQAIFNMVQNAAKAIGAEPGRSISVRIAPPEVGREVGPNHRVVQVVVEDDGPGMSAAVREKCMKPSSQVGVTGMGMTIVHAMLESANGTIDIQSPPSPSGGPGSAAENAGGTGTRIVLSFPIHTV